MHACMQTGLQGETCSAGQLAKVKLTGLTCAAKGRSPTAFQKRVLYTVGEGRRHVDEPWTCVQAACLKAAPASKTGVPTPLG
mmetsp:Transcript_78671/g.230830  ORF Transcript_78671/g.230830 Transcript_78671/m.230830 type:complete len:82 (+) Transcript_78671:170-415(+)